jgi:hypothetical protein
VPGYNTTVTAQFTLPGLSGLAGRNFEIRLDADEALSPRTLGDGSLPNIKGEAGNPVSIMVQSRDGATQRTLSLNAQGSIFKLAADANVVLAVDNVILKGLSAGHTVRLGGADFDIVIPQSTPPVDNTQTLVYVGQDNVFEMLGSAELTGNYNIGNGTGGDDSNTAGNGGAARVEGGILRMTGDYTKIHHNYAARRRGGISCIGGNPGGAVYMTGEYAEVSYNVGQNGTGGILIDEPACYFEMSGSHAKIIGNQGGTTGMPGGGIQLYGAGTIGVMSGEYAEISGNYTAGDGGGVFAHTNAQFIMSGGEITGNTCGAGFNRPQIAQTLGGVAQWAAGVQGWVRDQTHTPNDYCYTAEHSTQLMDFATFANYDITRIYVNGAGAP